jgi:hypothetical protein
MIVGVVLIEMLSRSRRLFHKQAAESGSTAITVVVLPCRL